MKCQFCHKAAEKLSFCPILLDDGSFQEYLACLRCNARYVTDAALLARNRHLNSVNMPTKDCPIHFGGKTPYPVQACQCEEQVELGCTHDNLHLAQEMSLGSQVRAICDDCECDVTGEDE